MRNMEGRKFHKLHHAKVKELHSRSIGGESRSQEARDHSTDPTRTSAATTSTSGAQNNRQTSVKTKSNNKRRRVKPKRRLKQNEQYDFRSNSSDIYIPKLNLLGLPGAMNAAEIPTTAPPMYLHPNFNGSRSSVSTSQPNSYNINKKGVVSISVPIIALAIFGFLAIAVCFARTFTSKRIKNFYYVANDDVSGQEVHPYEGEGNVELGPYGYDYDV